MNELSRDVQASAGSSGRRPPVGPRAAVEQVVATAAIDVVIAVAAEESAAKELGYEYNSGIVAVAAVDFVVAIGTVDDVFPRPAFKEIGS